MTLIDHLAENRTRATFFGFSHYSHVGQPLQNVSSSSAWTWNEWTVNRDHGAWIHDFYQDCDRAGIKPIPDAPNCGVQFQKRFSNEWRKVIGRNRTKYEKLPKLPQTEDSRPATAIDGAPDGGESGPFFGSCAAQADVPIKTETKPIS